MATASVSAAAGSLVVMNNRVIVVGGGLAGLGAAAALGHRRFRVTLLESRSRWGGRASSFVDQATGEEIDNCQHVNLGCGTNFRHFCRTVGIDSFFIRETELTFIGPDGRTSSFSAAPLPAPLHLFPSLLRLPYLSFCEKRQLAFGLRTLARTKPDCAGDESFLHWLERHGQSKAVIDRFWHVVLVSALSESLDRIDIAHARKVFVDAFLANRQGWEVWLPTAPLGELYGSRLEEWLSRHNVLMRQQCGVKRVLIEKPAEGDADAGRASGVELRTGERIDADHVILAVPHHLAASLLPDDLGAAAPFDALAKLESAPISSIHLWFDRPITQLRHAVLVGRLSQWMFNRSAIHEGDSSVNSAAPSKGPPTPPLRMGGDDAGRFVKSKIQNPKSKIFYYQVVISASREVLDRRNDETIRDVLEELSNIWPIVREARLIHARLVTEHKAVISMLPEVDRLRPVQQTPIGNLQLAGDWTQTGWPGTMEGAVRSGYLAAQNVLRQCGRDETLVQPDLPRAPLSKLLFGL